MDQGKRNGGERRRREGKSEEREGKEKNTAIGQLARRENSTQQASISACFPSSGLLSLPSWDGGKAVGKGNPGISPQRTERTGRPAGVYGSREGGKGHVVGAGGYVAASLELPVCRFSLGGRASECGYELEDDDG